MGGLWCWAAAIEKVIWEATSARLHHASCFSRRTSTSIGYQQGKRAAPIRTMNHQK